jgi:hypothetical protein
MGIVHVRWTHPYMNNYNRWFSIATRGNHNIQFLFTKTYSLAIIHHITKYISKPEAPLHSKLTTLQPYERQCPLQLDLVPTLILQIKQKMLKLSNKLGSLREVRVPKAISHFLKFLEHHHSPMQTLSSFILPHTLTSIKDLIQQYSTQNNDKKDGCNSEIITTDCGFISLSF